MAIRPRCSVIIPTRNCLDFLPSAVASIRMQRLDNVEILVVDDASTDETWEWLESTRRNDPLLIPIRGAGKGPSAARNVALAKARAPLVAFLDADDYWWPNKLSRQLSFHEANPDFDLSFTDYLHVDPRGEVRGTCFEYWRPRFIDRRNFDFSPIRNAELNILALNVVGTSTVVATTRALHKANGFITEYHSAEDWHLWLRLAAVAPVAASPSVMTTYLMHQASVTNARDTRTNAMRKIIHEYEQRMEPDVRRALRMAQSRIASSEAEHARELGESWSAVRGSLKAFVKWPQRRNARAIASNLAAAAKPVLMANWTPADLPIY